MAPETTPSSAFHEDGRFVEQRATLARTIERHAAVGNERILRAFMRVPRAEFVPEPERSRAYRDIALPIGFDQTISQPSMIAIMLDALDVAPEHRVLEIGAGSGYAAALLGELAREVYAVEIVPELAALAQTRLRELGYGNVHVVAGNGRFGFPERAPYDRVLVSAGAEEVPAELLRELAVGGRIAIPVSSDRGQTLVLGEKTQDGMQWQRSIDCIFVPLTGKPE